MNLIRDIDSVKVRELFIDGFTKVEKSLSQYISEEVELKMSEFLVFCSINELDDYLENLWMCWNVNVSQSFNGLFLGNSHLLFKDNDCRELINLFEEDDFNYSEEFNEMDKITFCEIGNTIFNTCMGSIINKLNLKNKLEYSLPVFHRTVNAKLSEKYKQNGNGTKVIILSAELMIKNHDIRGNLSIILENKFIDVCSDEIDKIGIRIVP